MPMRFFLRRQMMATEKLPRGDVNKQISYVAMVGAILKSTQFNESRKMEMDSGMRYDFTKFVKSAQAIPGRNVWHFQSHLAPDADLVEKLRSGAFADVMEHVDE